MTATDELARTPAERLDLLARLLGADPAAGDAGLEELLAEGVVDRIWLTLAVLQGRLPLSDDVVAWSERVRQEGASALLAEARRKPRPGAVRVVVGGVVVDAHDTVHIPLTTGIQRVARAALDEWSAKHEFRLTAWSPDYMTLIEQERDAFRLGVRGRRDRTAEAVIPWRSHFVVPELMTQVERLERIQALAEFSGNTTGVIGFDTVPVTSSETTGPGMPAAFARQLSAISRFDRIAAISVAAAEEYHGWGEMLPSAGLQAPEIRAVTLPTIGVPASDAPESLRGLGLSGAPLILCVGSHEPRKNHGAVLFAGARLWREGLTFQLVFCGGNAWGSEGFVEELDELAGRGMPVKSLRGVREKQLAALYSRARFTVFPSLNEGFGLPVAESLAAGTPVITSRYGSMVEIAAHGGALLVDPRDDDDITDAMRRLLVDDELLETLQAEARSMPFGSWAEYADELWAFLVGSPASP